MRFIRLFLPLLNGALGAQGTADEGKPALTYRLGPKYPSVPADWMQGRGLL